MSVNETLRHTGKSPDLFLPVRLLWLLPAVLALVGLIATIPATLEGIYGSWQALNSYPAVSEIIGYQGYALYLLLLRHLAALSFWLAGLFVYVNVGLRNSEFSRIGLFSALMLFLFPGPFFLETLDATTALPPAWDAWITGANQLLAALALASFVLFAYVFPDGSVAPRKLRWAAYFFVAGMAINLFLLMNDGPDWTWFAFMLIFLSGLLIGLAGQVYRYRRLATLDQRRQTKWVVAALAIQPLSFISGFGLGESDWGNFIGAHVQIILPALLPLSLLAAMLRRGLWGVSLSESSWRWTWISGSLLAVFWIGGIGLALQTGSAGMGQAVAIEPLPTVEQSRLVVIDNDMDPNDWMAILYLLQRPEVEVLAITISGTGETHCEPGVRNALGLTTLSGGGDIPVACGRETPLQGDHVFPTAWREMADNPKGGGLPAGRNTASGRTAAELLIDTIGDAPRQVTVVTLGPLTNLAEAIQKDPTFLENIAQVYVMGGALEVLGNVGFSGVEIDNQVAEWNVFIDPLALEVVLASGAQVTLVPLDATNHVPIDLDFYFQLASNRRTPEAELTYDLLAGQLDFVASGGYFFWDPLTAALAVDESLGYIKEGNIWVSTGSGSNSGLTRLLKQGYPARYAKWADAAAFEADFLRTLNQP